MYLRSDNSIPDLSSWRAASTTNRNRFSRRSRGIKPLKLHRERTCRSSDRWRARPLSTAWHHPWRSTNRRLRRRWHRNRVSVSTGLWTRNLLSNSKPISSWLCVNLHTRFRTCAETDYNLFYQIILEKNIKIRRKYYCLLCPFKQIFWLLYVLYTIKSLNRQLSLL